MIKFQNCFLLLFIAIFALSLTNCAKPANENKQAIRAAALSYFNTYAEREDWEKFLDHYSDSLFFEDKIAQIETKGIDEFKDFYNWPDPRYEKHEDHEDALILEELIIDGKTAVGRGYFTPLYWDGKLYTMEWGGSFTIWLHYNDDLKIDHQIDWIEYSGDVLIDIGNKIEAEFQ